MRSCRVSLALFAIAASAAHAACTDPTYARLKPPVYPQSAVAAKAGGHVLIEVTVPIDGVPRDFIMRQSSGNADLDQAALDALAKWRFHPATCDGKAVVAKAVVPFEFSPVDDQTPQDSAGTVPSASKDKREIAADPQPIDATSAADLLKRLENDESVQRLPPRKIDESTTRSMYAEPGHSAVFDVIQSTEHGWNAATGGGWTSIIRTRYVPAEHVTRELYAQLCDGDSEWCQRLLVGYLQRMRENPPPIPPPPPPRANP